MLAHFLGILNVMSWKLWVQLSSSKVWFSFFLSRQLIRMDSHCTLGLLGISSNLRSVLLTLVGLFWVCPAHIWLRIQQEILADYLYELWAHSLAFSFIGYSLILKQFCLSQILSFDSSGHKEYKFSARCQLLPVLRLKVIKMENSPCEVPLFHVLTLLQNL